MLRRCEYAASAAIGEWSREQDGLVLRRSSWVRSDWCERLQDPGVPRLISMSRGTSRALSPKIAV